MRIALFGATGPTGRQVLDQALAAGHQVTAAVRRPAALAPRPGLTVVAADVADAPAVASAIAGADAVLSTLGVPYSRRPVTVYSTGAANIVAGMRAHGVRRLAAVSSGMIGARRPPGPLLQRRLLDPLLRHGPGRTL